MEFSTDRSLGYLSKKHTFYGLAQGETSRVNVYSNDPAGGGVASKVPGLLSRGTVTVPLLTDLKVHRGPRANASLYMAM